MDRKQKPSDPPSKPPAATPYPAAEEFDFPFEIQDAPAPLPAEVQGLPAALPAQPADSAYPGQGPVPMAWSPPPIEDSAPPAALPLAAEMWTPPPLADMPVAEPPPAAEVPPYAQVTPAMPYAEALPPADPTADFAPPAAYSLPGNPAASPWGQPTVLPGGQPTVLPAAPVPPAAYPIGQPPVDSSWGQPAVPLPATPVPVNPAPPARQTSVPRRPGAVTDVRAEQPYPTAAPRARPTPPAALPEQAPPYAPVPAGYETVPAPVPPRPSTLGRTFPLVLIVLLLLGGGGTVAYIFVRPHPDKDDGTAVVTKSGDETQKSDRADSTKSSGGTTTKSDGGLGKKSGGGATKSDGGSGNKSDGGSGNKSGGDAPVKSGRDRPTKSGGETPKANDTALIVSGDGTTSFRKISDAVRAYQTGKVIKVRPGVYNESLVLERDVQLEGDGDRASIVVWGSDAPALTANIGGGVVRNLTLRSRSTNPEKVAPVVLITRSDLHLEDCDVGFEVIPDLTNLPPCVAVESQTAKPELARCKLHHGAVGVQIKDGAKPVLERCTFESNHYGINVEEGEGNVRSCTFTDNNVAVFIQKGGNPMLSSCNITGCKTFGVVLGGRARGTFLDCTIDQSQEAGVWVKEGANLTLQRCKVLKSDSHGLNVEDGGESVTLIECEFARNSKDGVLLQKSRANLQNCLIHHNEAMGVNLRESRATLTTCTLNDNGKSGLRASGADADAVLVKCKIYNNKVWGVELHGKGRVDASGCRLADLDNGNRLVDLNPDGKWVAPTD